MERKHYLDNIRWMTVVLVMVYHVLYIFNSQAVVSNFPVQGIELLDGFLYIVYPWFMTILFVVAGVCAKHALAKKSGKAFLKDRFVRLILPSFFVPMLIGWFCGYVTDYYTDIFSGNGDKMPDIIKYAIYCAIGEGPMWFARELFLAVLILMLIRKIDKKGRLDALCERMKWWGFIVLFFVFWGSSYVLNAPLIEVYRNGIYIVSFLMGYYIFSTDEHIATLEKGSKLLVPAALLLMIGYYAYMRVVIEPQATDDVLTTVNYTSKSVLQHPFTNLYAWIAMLAIFSVARKHLNFYNRFSAYMTKANFGYYALHYPALAIVAFFTLEKTNLPIWGCYLVNLFGMIVLSTLLYLVLSKIPVLRTLTLGIRQRGKQDASQGRNSQAL